MAALPVNRQPTRRRCGGAEIREYLASINPIAKSIVDAQDSVVTAYGIGWGSLSVDERDGRINRHFLVAEAEADAGPADPPSVADVADTFAAVGRRTVLSDRRAWRLSKHPGLDTTADVAPVGIGTVAANPDAAGAAAVTAGDGQEGSIADLLAQAKSSSSGSGWAKAGAVGATLPFDSNLPRRGTVAAGVTMLDFLVDLKTPEELANVRGDAGVPSGSEGSGGGKKKFKLFRDREARG